MLLSNLLPYRLLRPTDSKSDWTSSIFCRFDRWGIFSTLVLLDWSSLGGFNHFYQPHFSVLGFNLTNVKSQEFKIQTQSPKSSVSKDAPDSTYHDSTYQKMTKTQRSELFLNSHCLLPSSDTDEQLTPFCSRVNALSLDLTYLQMFQNISATIMWNVLNYEHIRQEKLNYSEKYYNQMSIFSPAVQFGNNTKYG